jgi:quinol monooxygenase YgiN
LKTGEEAFARRKFEKTQEDDKQAMAEYPSVYALHLGVDSICRIAQFQVREPFIERCEEAVRAFVQHVKQNEPGTLLYVSFQGKRDRTQFVHLMVFENAEALARHGLSQESKQLMEILNPHLVSYLASSNFERVAST